MSHTPQPSNIHRPEFYFLGDGSVAAAIVHDADSSECPYGIALIGDPSNVSRIEGTLLYHPDRGLQRTMLTVIIDGKRYTPQSQDTVVRHIVFDKRHCIEVTWSAGPYNVIERFYIDPSIVIRDVVVENTANDLPIHLEVALYANPILFNEFSATESGELKANGYLSISVSCDQPARAFERFLTVDGSRARFVYRIGDARESHQTTDPSNSHPASTTLDGVELTLIEKCFTGIRAVTSHSGRFNAAIFQYDFEWGLDASMVASAAVCAGDFTLAKEILTNILTRLSNSDGMIAEAGRFRGRAMAELNGNGGVLDAVRRYMFYSRDTAFIESHWDRIRAIADYPLRDEFQHPSGLLKTQRDFWERPPWMGVNEGFELGHQVLCAVGLYHASVIAAQLGHNDNAQRWRSASESIANAMQNDPTYSLIEDGKFIHRRLIDGTIQSHLTDQSYADNDYAPFLDCINPGAPKPCEPDATEALPIALRMIGGHTDVARKTLDTLESLWNPCGDGGYARYNIASDPDSPGAWPFATAFIAAAELEAGLLDRAKRSIDWLTTTAGTSGSWYEYYGTRPDGPLPPVGVIVWGWAQYILLYVEHLLGITISNDAIRIAPKLIGYSHVAKIGEHTLTVTVNGLDKATMDGSPVAFDGGVVTVPLPLMKSSALEFLL